MATKKAAKTSRKTAKRSASARSRKPAGGIASRSKKQAAARPSEDLTFMGMLADIFGFRKAAPASSRRNAR